MTSGFHAALFEEVRAATVPRLICDAQRKDMPIVAVNEAFVALTGYAMEECVGRNCRFLQGVDTDRETLDQIKQALANRTAMACEILNYRKDGAPFWIALFLHPIFDAEGRLVYYTSLQIDVTHRRTGMRSADLAAQLAETMGMVAHELRNPMTPIVGAVQILRNMANRQGDMAPGFLKVIDRLELATDVFLRRANVLLEFSRLVSGKFEIHPGLLDVADAVRAAVERHEILSGLAGTRLEATAPSSLMVNWDRVAIEQIFDNLISNALKYCDGKPIEIGVVDDGEAVSIAIRDHGAGIAPEDADAIFKRFEQGGARRGAAGFGVGLWVVRGLCEAMGGSVKMTSRPGDGATFTVRLPKNAQERAP